VKRPLVARLPREHALEVWARLIDVAELLLEQSGRPLGEIELYPLGQPARTLCRQRGAYRGHEILGAIRLRCEARQSVP